MTTILRAGGPKNARRTFPGPRLIVSDFDGTMATAGRGLSKALAAVIRRYTRLGGRFVIATARPRFAVEGYIRTVPGIRHLILCNGSLVVDRETGKVLFSRPFGRIDAARLVRKLWDDPRFIVLLIGLNETLSNRAWPSGPLSRYMKELKVRIAARSRTLGLLASGWKVMNAEISADPRVLARLAVTLKSEFTGRLTSRISWPGFMEVYPSTVSKGRALDFLAGRFGIRRSEIAAFGDADNDLELFSRSGLRVAVSNATPQLRSKAHHVAGHYMEDGVARFIAQRLLRT